MSQRASAAFSEFGWQPLKLTLKPWLRAGYRSSSGDDNPQDGRNGTFYQALGATRRSARFPFYNMMNLKDAYGLPARSVRARKPRFAVRCTASGSPIARTSGTEAEGPVSGTHSG